MNTSQLLLTIILTISTIFLIVIGIQLIFVLKELRIILKKINEIIKAFEKVGGSLEHGFSEILGFVAGIKTLFKVFEILHNKKNGKSKDR